jgi:polar amino acid transport system permease protein
MWELLGELQSYLIPLLTGAWWTIALCAVSAVFAVVLGLLACFGRMSQNRLFKYPAKFYIDVIRGTPLLLQLFYIYYALPELGVVIPAFVAGVMGLSLNFGAYLAEVFRAGIQSIDNGQHDASRSLGLGRFQRMRLVIMPQAFRTMYPALANYALVIIKESALVAVIGVYELMHAGELLAGSTFQATQVYTMVAVMYLAMCSVVARAFALGERRLIVPGYWEAEATSKAMGKG